MDSGDLIKLIVALLFFGLPALMQLLAKKKEVSGNPHRTARQGRPAGQGNDDQQIADRVREMLRQAGREQPAKPKPVKPRVQAPPTLSPSFSTTTKEVGAQSVVTLQAEDDFSSLEKNEPQLNLPGLVLDEQAGALSGGDSLIGGLAPGKPWSSSTIKGKGAAAKAAAGLKKDPRLAIIYHEILGRPVGLR